MRNIILIILLMALNFSTSFNNVYAQEGTETPPPPTSTPIPTANIPPYTLPDWALPDGDCPNYERDFTKQLKTDYILRCGKCIDNLGGNSSIDPIDPYPTLPVGGLLPTIEPTEIPGTATPTPIIPFDDLAWVSFLGLPIDWNVEYETNWPGWSTKYQTITAGNYAEASLRTTYQVAFEYTQGFQHVSYPVHMANSQYLTFTNDHCETLEIDFEGDRESDNLTIDLGKTGNVLLESYFYDTPAFIFEEEFRFTATCINSQASSLITTADYKFSGKSSGALTNQDGARTWQKLLAYPGELIPEDIPEFGYCSMWKYVDAEGEMLPPVVDPPDLNIWQGECMTMIPAFSWGKDTNLPFNVDINFPGFGICPVWVEITPMSIAGFEIPMDIVYLPALMFVLDLMFKL